MARGGRPKREAKKTKKTPPSASSVARIGIIPTPEVEVIRKKRRPRDEEF